MLATRENITRYIPQRHPMVMVHGLLEANDTYAVTSLSVEPENIFVSKEYLREPGLVENIAQTAAAQVGYQCSIKNFPVPIGYIAAVKDLVIMRLPKLNAVLTTSVKITNQIFDITVVEGKIETSGQLCCTCEMRIFAKIES